MAESKYKKTRNPKQVTSVEWSKYSLETIAMHVGTASEIPETEVEWEGTNSKSKPEKWERYTAIEKGTKAMQSYYGTDYTYAQAKDYLEKNGYKVKLMAVENGYEGYVVKAKGEVPVSGEERQIKKVDLNELFEKKASHKKTTLNVKPESKELLTKMCEGYPWGVRGAVEAEIIDKALEMYAKENGFIS